jgi:hypothetical protein
MKSFNQFTPQQAAQVRYVLCDIDDTITTDGKLTAAAYTALWRLHDAGIQVIPVTGRPAGWCDLIVRQWPVRAVVGENGAFVYYFKDSHLHTFTHPSVAQGDIQGRLQAVKDACLAGVPGCRVSKDQFARIYDIAIDFNEDPPYLGFEAAEQIRAICESMGATAKVSSIHVNAWYGSYDKVRMTQLFFETILGESEAGMKESVLFFGDSPNDEPMFAYFPLATAVANIKPFADGLTHLPAYVTEKCSGEGFALAVDRLLALRAQANAQ